MRYIRKIVVSVAVLLGLIAFLGCPKHTVKESTKKEKSLTFSLLEDTRSQYNISLQSWIDVNQDKAKELLADTKLKPEQLDKELKKLKPIELDISQIALNMHNTSTNEDLIEGRYNEFNLDIFRSSKSETKLPINKVLTKPFLDNATISNTLYSANRIGTLGQSDWQAQFRRGLIMLHVGAIAGWRLNPLDKRVKESIKQISAPIKPGKRPEDIDNSDEIDNELRVRAMLHSIIERKARLTSPNDVAKYLVAALEAAGRLDQDQAAPHYLLALSYWHAGDLDNALLEVEAGNRCKKLSWPLIPPQPNAEAELPEQLEAADLFMRYQPPGTGIKRSSRHLLSAAGIWSTPEKVQAVRDMWLRLIELNGPVGDWATLTCADSLAMYAYLQEERGDLLKYKLDSKQLSDWKQPIEFLKTQISHKQQLELMLKTPQEYWSTIHEQITARRKSIKQALSAEKAN